MNYFLSHHVIIHQYKAYKTEEGKANIKALVAIDLLELRRVPKGTKKLLVLEPTQKRSARSKKTTPGQPTAEELERRHEEKNVEINRENSLLMKKRLELFSFFVKLCIPAVLPVKAWEKNHKQKKISRFATATDEGFAMILFENNSEIFLAMGESGKKTFKELKQLEKYEKLQPKYTACSGREVGWVEKGLERFEELVEATMVNRGSTETNNATYVDMDSKFYDDVRNHEGNGTVITLNAPKARKRKRRFTELN